MFSIKHESRFTKITLGIILALFLGLCFASFTYHSDTLLGSLEKMDNDDVKYLRSAWTFLDTGKLTYQSPENKTVFIMPGLTILLSGFCAVFGRLPIIQFKIFQAILGACSIYIIFLAGRKMYSSGAGLAAAFLAAIYSAAVYVTNLILTEAVFAFLFVLLFYVSFEAVDRKSMKLYLWGGVVLGLATLFRPTVLLYPVAIFVIWFIKKYKAAEMLKYGSAVVGVVILILSPWMVRNYVVFDRFIPLTISSGNPFAQGTYIDYDQEAEVENDRSIDYVGIITKRAAEKGMDINDAANDEIVLDFVEKQRGIIRVEQVMTEEPLRYIKWYTIGKTAENWSRPFLWINLFGTEFKLTNNQHTAYLILGFIGILYTFLRKRQNPFFYMALLTILYFNTVYLPFYCFSRYMYPVMFCWMLFAGFLLYDIFTHIFGRIRKGAGA